MKKIWSNFKLCGKKKKQELVGLHAFTNRQSFASVFLFDFF